MSKEILVVEDSPSIMKLITVVAEKGGFIVHGKTNGLDAMSILQTRTFDMVISDENLPHVTGSEIARYMRQTQEHADTPMILVSAEENSSYFGELMQNKVISSYLPKPFSMARLNQLIHIFLNSRNSTATEKYSVNS